MVAWVLVTLLAVTVAHLIVVALALRNGALDRDDARTSTVSGDVECPDCGAVNGSGYRYCRRCVSTLPGGTPGGHPGDRRAGRRTW